MKKLNYELPTHEETEENFGLKRMRKKFQKLVDGKTTSIIVKADKCKFEVLGVKGCYSVKVIGDLKKLMDRFSIPESKYFTVFRASDIDDFTNKLNNYLSDVVGCVGTECKKRMEKGWSEAKAVWLK